MRAPPGGARRPPRAAVGYPSAGTVEVKVRRVDDRRVDEATGERQLFSSKILPPWYASRRR